MKKTWLVIFSVAFAAGIVMWEFNHNIFYLAVMAASSTCWFYTVYQITANSVPWAWLQWLSGLTAIATTIGGMFSGEHKPLGNSAYVLMLGVSFVSTVIGIMESYDTVKIVRQLIRRRKIARVERHRKAKQSSHSETT